MVSHGSPQKKLRTISCSSASETEADASENQTQDDILMKRPPPVHRVAVLNEVARSVVILFFVKPNKILMEFHLLFQM